MSLVEPAAVPYGCFDLCMFPRGGSEYRQYNLNLSSGAIEQVVRGLALSRGKQLTRFARTHLLSHRISCIAEFAGINPLGCR